jgi:hypothetical protein
MVNYCRRTDVVRDHCVRGFDIPCSGLSADKSRYLPSLSLSVCLYLRTDRWPLLLPRRRPDVAHLSSIFAVDLCDGRCDVVLL